MSPEIYIRIKNRAIVDKVQEVAKTHNVSVDVIVGKVLEQCNNLKLIDKVMGPMGLSGEDESRR